MAAAGDGRFNDVSGFSNRPPHRRQSVPWSWGKYWKFSRSCGGQDTIRTCRQPPVTHANHEDTLTNVRAMRSAINDGPSSMVDVREWNPTSPGSRGSSTRATLTPTFHIEISYFLFFLFLSSGGWVKIKLKLPHFHLSDTRTCVSI